MKYRLIASDIDGTLLDSRKSISPRTLRALKKAMESGAVFAVSSGRSILFCDYFKDISGIDDIPFILYNGAKIVAGADHHVIYRQELSEADALWLIDAGNKAGTTVIVWADDTLYVNEINERTAKYERLALMKPVLLTDPEETVKKGVSKVLWFDETDRGPYLRGILDNGPIRSHINYFTSDPRFMEIVDSRCSKATALSRLCELYDIPQAETIAFGDGYNDLPMIEWAGLGVAMSNASEEIKQKADTVTLSNDEDGVAVMLEKYF